MAIISSSRELSLEETAIVIQILESLRFVINREKSTFIPLQKIDSVELTISLPERKIIKFLRTNNVFVEEAPMFYS